MRWASERASLDDVGVDGVEAGPMSVEEILAPLCDPVARPLGRVAEDSRRVIAECRLRYVEHQAADVDSDETRCFLYRLFSHSAINHIESTHRFSGSAKQSSRAISFKIR